MNNITQMQNGQLIIDEINRFDDEILSDNTEDRFTYTFELYRLAARVLALATDSDNAFEVCEYGCQLHVDYGYVVIAECPIHAEKKTVLFHGERFGQFKGGVERAVIMSSLTEEKCYELLMALGGDVSRDKFMYVLNIAMLLSDNGHDVHAFATFIASEKAGQPMIVSSLISSLLDEVDNKMGDIGD